MKNNSIHPTAIIDERVNLGENNVIHPYTIIHGPTDIGDNNIIGPNVVIGSPGQDTNNPRYDSTNSYIKIGNNCIIREFTAIQKPCYKEITELKDNVYLMQSVHIPHDAIIHSNVVITPMCVLAGITTILNGASLGLGTNVNQYSIIGHHSFVAMGSNITRNVRPFTIYVKDNPNKVNQYAIKKRNFEEFTDEICRYVLENKSPQSKEIQIIIEEYERLHIDSKRKEY